MQGQAQLYGDAAMNAEAQDQAHGQGEIVPTMFDCLGCTVAGPEAWTPAEEAELAALRSLNLRQLEPQERDGIPFAQDKGPILEKIAAGKHMGPSVTSFAIIDCCVPQSDLGPGAWIL